MKVRKLFRGVIASVLALSMMLSPIASVQAEAKGSTNVASPITLPGDLETVAGNKGIKFGLYDYSIDINKDADGNFSELSKYFMFRSSGESGVDYGPANQDYDEGNFEANHSTVERNLVNGYPVLDFTRRADGTAKEPATKTDGTTFSQSERSLGYLFGAGHPEVTSYPVNNTLLQYNETTGHYTYDAKINAVDYDSVNNKFLLRNYAERGHDAAGVADRGERADLNDFFPFNTTNGVERTKKHSNGYLYDHEKADINYWFGMTMETNFLQPKDGITDKGEDMIFRFSGDDDVWVFVDDILVLDIGGAHARVTGYIDFESGLVVAYTDSYQGVKTAYWSTTIYESYKAAFEAQGMSASEVNAKLAELFESTGETVKDENGKSFAGYRFKDYSTHQMKMYYMERCSGAANCLIDFNLQTIPDNAVTVEKAVTGLNEEILKEQSYKMRLMVKGVEDEEFTPWNNTAKSTVELDEDGYFFLKDGEKAEFAVPDGSQFYVEEYNVSDYNVSFTYNDENAVNVTVAENGTATSATYNMAEDRNDVLVGNAAKPYEVEIDKIFSGANLDGNVPDGFEATFSLYKYDTEAGTKVGNPIASVKFSEFENGSYTFEGLLPGTYFIEESEVSINEELNLVFEGVQYSSNPIELTAGTPDLTVTIENNYEFESKQLVVTKDVEGAHADYNKEFTFTLKVTDKDGNAYTEDLTVVGGNALTAENGVYTFTLKDGEAVDITMPYGYGYEVAEADYEADGYVTTVKQIANTEAATLEEVTAENPCTGTLTTDAKVTFVNTDIEPVDVNLNVEKILVDVTGEFEFVLTPGENTPGKEQTATNAANGDVVFDKLTFDSVGTYTYTLREVKGTDGDVIYDESVYNVTIEIGVTDDKSAYEVKNMTITKNGKAYTDDTITFTNKHREATSVVIEATKILDDAPSATEFSFVLEGTDCDGNEVRQEIKNDAAGAIKFEELTFDKAGTYVFTISEVINAEDDSIIYDKVIYEAEITVTIPNDNVSAYQTTVVYKKTADSTVVNALEFVNKTRIPATVDLAASKLLEGEVPTPESFWFTLDGETMEAPQVRTTNEKGIVNFDTLTFNEVGTFTYTISEVKGNDEDIIYDKAEYDVTIVVTAPEDSDSYVATVTYEKDGESVNGAAFENGTRAHVELALEAQKTMDGEVPEEGKFTFTLASYDNPDTILETVANDAEGKIQFSAIEYEKSGVYTYIISEVLGEDETVVYDRNTFVATVTVVAPEDDGAYKASVEYKEVAAQTGLTEDAETVVFDNTTRPSAFVELDASKLLDGKLPKEGQFTFELRDENGEVIQTVTNDAEGLISFEALEFNASGTYTYTISEVIGDDKWMDYDEAVYTVTIVVTADIESADAFQADVTITDENGEEVEGIEFINKTIPKPVETGDHSNVILWAAMMILAGAVIIFTFRRKRA